MTIQSTTRKVQFLGNGVATSFPFTFKAFTTADFQATKTSTTGIDTALVLNTNFSVALNADQNASPGGTVTYPISGSPLANGEKLTILTAIAQKQNTDITNNGGFYPQVIEDEFDYLTILSQQLQEIADRTVKIPSSDNVAANTLGNAAARANTILYFDSTGQPYTVTPASLGILTAYATANTDQFVATAGQTVFTLTNNPSTINNLDVTLDGVTLLPATDFTWSGTTLTLLTGALVGQRLAARYMQGLPSSGVGTGSVVDASLAAGSVIYSIEKTFERTQTEINVGVTPTNFGYASHSACGFVLPERYGAVGNGSAADTVNGALDTTAINTAILVAATAGCPVLLSRAYVAVPATVTTDEAGAITAAFPIRSNMRIVATRGASITLANGQSTDGAPKSLAMFHTNGVVSNLVWQDLLMDMNGANNKISPSRPATYNNSFNHAMISISGTPAGVAAKADDVLVQNCTFQNTNGTNCIVGGQTNTAGLLLGKRWTVRGSLFLNNGLDCNDHTSVYAWCENVLIEGNTFWEDTPTGTTGKTGGYAAWEVHGARTRCVGNLVYQYYRGCYVATNTTNPVVDTVIVGNTFYPIVTGIEFFRSAANQPTIQGVVIADNTFFFDDGNLLAIQNYKSAIALDGILTVSDIKIRGNYARKSGTGVTAMFARLLVGGTAANPYNDIVVTENNVKGFTVGAYITTNATNGMGNVQVQRNEFNAFVPATFGNAFGVIVDATGTIKTLTLDGNRLIDEQGSPTFTVGISLSNGTITDYYLGEQLYKGIVTTQYQETGGITITNRRGPNSYGVLTYTSGAAMTPDFSRGRFQTLTLTDGVAWTINAPTNPGPAGGVFTLTVRNTFGAIGAATFNAVFKMPGAGWVNPGGGSSRSMTWRYDGTTWVAISWATGDVNN